MNKTTDSNEQPSETVANIHKLMFPISYKVIYPETQQELGYPIAKSIEALIEQRCLEARIDELKGLLNEPERSFTSRGVGAGRANTVEGRIAQLSKLKEETER